MSTARGIDTGVATPNGVWRLERVQGARTRDHEWGLLPLGNHELLINGTSAATSHYDAVRRIKPNELGPHGPTSPITTVITRTGVQPSDIVGDASLVHAVVEGARITTTEALPAPLNMPVYWDGHPTVSADGSILVFASDRPGGAGGTDLWYAVRNGQQWSTPQLVEGDVNTPCDELTPMFCGDTLLAFASAGHDTYGGYDVFTSRIVRSGASFTLSSVRNVGAPVNTPYDELFPRWADRETFYYGSDQPLPNQTVRKDFDVFVLWLERPKVPATKTPSSPKERATVKGTVVHQQTQEPVPNADVTARDVTTNTVVASTRTDTTGTYELDVPVETPINVSAQAPDLFYDDVRINVPKEQARDTMKIEQPLQLPITFVLRVNFPTAIFDAPYPFTLDSTGAETQQTWEQTLDLLATNVKVSGDRLQRLVLIGHTDDVDTDENNLVLGRQRVEFIMDQLVERGVSRDILEGRSAGETLLPDRKKNESIDIWRKRARRVELVKVLRQ
jgi:outer membrane protein OmpA-like peptidoglycan-associated protein